MTTLLLALMLAQAGGWQSGFANPAAPGSQPASAVAPLSVGGPAAANAGADRSMALDSAGAFAPDPGAPAAEEDEWRAFPEPASEAPAVASASDSAPATALGAAQASGAVAVPSGAEEAAAPDALQQLPLASSPEMHPDAAPAQQAAYAARHAGGSLGAALRLIDDGLFDLKRAWGDQIIRLHSDASVAPNDLAKPFIEDAGTLGKCVSERDPEVSDTDASRVGLQTLLSAVSDFYLDGLRRCTGASVPAINEDQPEVVERLAALGERCVQACLKALAEADTNLGRNANIELTLEAMFIRLAHAGRAAVGVARAR